MKELLYEKNEIKSGIKSILSWFLTFFLIICTALCLVLVGKSAFSGNVSLFGCRIFYVITGSMEPTIHAGAIVLTRAEDTSKYQVGDIITFKSKTSAIYGQPNTHRIVDIHTDGTQLFFVTKGDANPVNDDFSVPASDVYGKVIWNSGKIEWLGYILSFLMTPVGFLLVILIPILAITVSQLKVFTKNYKQALIEAAMNSQALIDEQKFENQIESETDSTMNPERSEQNERNTAESNK